MSLPWYAAGAARPDYAKFQGWRQRDAAAQEIAQRVAQPVWQPTPAPAWTPPYVVAPPQPVVVVEQPRTPAADSWSSIGPWWDRVRAGWVQRESARRASQGTGTTPAQSWSGAVDWVTTVPQDDVQASTQGAPAVEPEEPHVLPLPQANPETISITGQGFVPPSEQSARPVTVLNEQPEWWWDQPGSQQAVRRYTRRNRDRQETAEPLTWDEYYAMSPEGQAAVQFNDTLYKAIERDRANQEKYEGRSEEEQEAYWGAVRDVFGTDVFPQVEGLRVAPETIAVLQQLDIPKYEDTGKGLDDYLRFDVAITEKQIGRLGEQLPALKFGPPPVEGNDTTGYEYTPQQERLNLAQNLTRAQQALNETLANGDVILANAPAIAANLAAAEFGGIPRRMETAPKGDFPEDRFNQYFAALADPDYGVEDSWNDIQEDIADKARDSKEAKQLTRALQNRLQQYVSGALDWGATLEGTGKRVRPIEDVLQGLRMPTVTPPKQEERKRNA